MTRKKEHVIECKRFLGRGSRDQSQSQLRDAPRGGGLDARVNSTAGSRLHNTLGQRRKAARTLLSIEQMARALAFFRRLCWP